VDGRDRPEDRTEVIEISTLSELPSALERIKEAVAP